MLSAFPYLLSYEMLAPLLLRVTLGAVFIYWSYKVFRGSNPSTNEKVIALIEGVAGILLVIGLWTQVAALVVVIDLAIRTALKIQKKSFLTDGVNYYLILLVMALSIMVTGAGWFAFDLPL